MASFDRQEKINTGNPIAGERRGRGGGKLLRSHVNTDTNLREEKRTVDCSRKRGFPIMNEKKEDICIIFLKEKSQSESGTNWAAHRTICNIITHPKEEKTILILYLNKNMK